MILNASDVRSGYARSTIVRGVDLAIEPGQVVVLLGPNGAGKTTLLRTLSGSIPLQSGSIVFAGENVSSWPASRRAQLGLCHLPEGRGIYPSLTVRENISLFARSLRDGSAIERAVDAFPVLAHKMKLLAGQLSGGQQQMLALVRALVRDEKLILIDEASMGLAPVIVDEIFEFIVKLARSGAAMLIVEQYVARALSVADYVHLFKKGTIVFSGMPSQVGDDVYDHYIGSSAMTPAT